MEDGKNEAAEKKVPDGKKVREALRICGTLLEDGVSVDCGSCSYYREDGSECDGMARDALELIEILEEGLLAAREIIKEGVKLNQEQHGTIEQLKADLKEAEEAYRNACAEVKARDKKIWTLQHKRPARINPEADRFLEGNGGNSPPAPQVALALNGSAGEDGRKK